MFATLIVPPLATRALGRLRLAAGWGLATAGYALGLIISTSLDLPTGPVIVWTLAALGVVTHAVIVSTSPASKLADR